MDRQSIERRDFPIARRGYEIEAVDAHLALLADEYDDIARRGRPSTGGGLASSAADQVRMIVEAAEQSAADIEREAQLEARQLRQDAREEAERVRGDAGRQARDHVTRVAEVARGLLDRVEAMDRELAGLLDGLRAGTQRLAADLSLLQTSVGDVREVTTAPGTGLAPGAARPEPEGGAAASGRLEPDGEAAGLGRSEPDGRAARSATEAEGAATPATGVDGGPSAGGDGSVAGDDSSEQHGARAAATEPLRGRAEPLTAAAPASEPSEPAAWEPDPPRPSGERDGARMVALNMALNGVPREDTRHHIEENFEIYDVGALLDEVYARAGR